MLPAYAPTRSLRRDSSPGLTFAAEPRATPSSSKRTSVQSSGKCMRRMSTRRSRACSSPAEMVAAVVRSDRLKDVVRRGRLLVRRMNATSPSEPRLWQSNTFSATSPIKQRTQRASQPALASADLITAVAPEAKELLSDVRAGIERTFPRLPRDALRKLQSRAVEQCLGDACAHMRRLYRHRFRQEDAELNDKLRRLRESKHPVFTHLSLATPPTSPSGKPLWTTPRRREAVPAGDAKGARLAKAAERYGNVSRSLRRARDRPTPCGKLLCFVRAFERLEQDRKGQDGEKSKGLGCDHICDILTAIIVQADVRDLIWQANFTRDLMADVDTGTEGDYALTTLLGITDVLANCTLLEDKIQGATGVEKRASPLAKSLLAESLLGIEQRSEPNRDLTSTNRMASPSTTDEDSTEAGAATTGVGRGSPQSLSGSSTRKSSSASSRGSLDRKAEGPTAMPPPQLLPPSQLVPPPRVENPLTLLAESANDDELYDDGVTPPPHNSPARERGRFLSEFPAGGAPIVPHTSPALSEKIKILKGRSPLRPSGGDGRLCRVGSAPLGSQTPQLWYGTARQARVARKLNLDAAAE